MAKAGAPISVTQVPRSVRPGEPLVAFFVTTSKALATRSDALVPSSFLLLVVRLGAPSSILVSSSDARSP